MSAELLKRRAIAEALKVVRGYMRTREAREFICLCLDSFCLGKGGNDAKAIIVERLQGSKTWEDWLRQFHPARYADLQGLLELPGGGQLRAGVSRAVRLAWLDSLIEEFSS
jgi:hypothetical protein